MTNGEIKPRVAFLIGPGFNSTSPHNKRNIDINVTEILPIVQINGVNGP